MVSPFPRASGLLLHPTSLPGAFGVGDLGPGAFGFLAFLEAAGQTLWQVLPLAPTGYGNSPYAAPSAFAGNPLLVACGPLLESGWLDEDDVRELRALPAERVDFARLVPLKQAVLRTAHRRFLERAAPEQRDAFEAFKAAEADWLDDHALFMALRDERGGPWTEWESPLRDRQPAALARARAAHADAVGRHAFAQYLFFDQWRALRGRAHALGIRIVGDIPIFVAHDSVDVWAHRDLFKLDADGRPRVVAGVPPDYFSATGQLWGNPLYDWDVLARRDYGWWIARFRHLLELVDVVRVDHFRGFQAAWEVPASATTAVDGAWVPGPGAGVFRAVDAALGGSVPVVAEDLGLITDDVRELVRATGYPGMKVLQFAFGGESDHPYLPHAYRDPNCVVYTGTHDNDTTRGWFASASDHERDLVRAYVATDATDVAWDLIRLALASVADTAIVPLQDVLDLGSEARMNLPGAAEGNWEWRVRSEQLTSAVAERLARLARVYGRAKRPGYP
jgi:4-alpha-glucanotransferase